MTVPGGAQPVPVLVVRQNKACCVPAAGSLGGVGVCVLGGWVLTKVAVDSLIELLVDCGGCRPINRIAR